MLVAKSTNGACEKERVAPAPAAVLRTAVSGLSIGADDQPTLPPQVLLWTSLNSLVALIGYYFAAFTVDKTWMGRTRLQAMGFTMIGILFGVCAIWYNQLLKGNLIHLFQFLYY